MKKRRVYASPAILQETFFKPEGQLLAGSVVDNIEKIESTGQDLTEFSSDDFTHNWVDE